MKGEEGCGRVDEGRRRRKDLKSGRMYEEGRKGLEEGMMDEEGAFGRGEGAGMKGEGRVWMKGEGRVTFLEEMVFCISTGCWVILEKGTSMENLMLWSSWTTRLDTILKLGFFFPPTISITMEKTEIENVHF
jgi:hypothetical protein